MNTHFSCVGCGRCCTGHHVPLTLAEAGDWARDGGQVIVLVEAFLDNGLGLPEAQSEHARRRSRQVSSGTAQAHVAITFAAFSTGRCRNLDDDNMCRIYERRPLVCRIYPMEINPHIPLRPEAKDCPPEAWQAGPLLLTDGRLVDEELAGLIERSRQADRDDIAAKEKICGALGIRTTALKGDGFTAYLPDMGAFVTALEGSEDGTGLGWLFHVSGADVAGELEAAGAVVNREGDGEYMFIPLRAA